MTVSNETGILSGFTWAGEAGRNAPLVLSYSFEEIASGYLSEFPEFKGAALASFRSFDTTDRALAREALQRWSTVSGLRFVETRSGSGDIRFSKFNLAAIPGMRGAEALSPSRT